jgi:hypothetical protein
MPETTRRTFGQLLAAGLAAPLGFTAAANGQILLDRPSGETGFEVERAFSGTPNPAGILKQYTVRLPHFEVATHYAAFQRHDFTGHQGNTWPDGSNRAQPLPIHDFRNLNGAGLFLLLQLDAAHYLALLPVTGTGTISWFASSGADLSLNVGTLGTGPVRGDLPLVAWARSQDPYEACRKVWETAVQHPLVGESTRLRGEKRVPDSLRYLGWCSWEEYKTAIDEKILLAAVDTIEQSGLPIRWVLVDDGHLDNQNRQLLGFNPDAAKFPHAWAPLLSRRKPEGIRWMGLWLNFNGYWNGIAVKNKLGDLNEHLARVPETKRAPAALQPKPGMEHAFAFYDAMIATERRAGFDFVKVDNQAHNLVFYRGTPQPVEAAAANAKALEFAAAFHMDGLINCMAHGPVNIFNTRVSAVTRCSEDYKLGDLPRAKRHIHNSYGNMTWLGQTVWGDHDMFHSDDPVAGRMMAVSKAVSGGPVYLSDNPKQFAVDRIRPLCFADGQLLPVLAPAAPLPESIFVDPFDERKPFRAIAPLANQAAAVVVYNLTDPEVPVEGYVTPDDYQHANGLMQPRIAPWKAPKEGLVCYDWYEKSAAALTAKLAFPMPKFSDRLLLLCPIRNGWAVIGRTDKYLSPSGVEILETGPGEVLVKMKEGGPLAVWQSDAQAAVQSPDCKFRRLAANLWQAEVSASGETLVRVRR